MNAWRLGCCVAALVAASAIAQTASVFINGAALDADKRRALEQAYGVPIQPGRYWYDAMSGVWGREGGPALGQIHPNLQLGPRLRADASSGNTRVFVNGRELHTMDVLALRRCTPAIHGRYWVLANGIGGYEGGPPTFNLAALCSAGGGGGSSTRCDNYGGGQFNCSNSRTGIGMIGEGGGKGAVFVDGKVLMTPN